MKIPESLKWKPTGETLGQGGQAQVYKVTNKEEDNGRYYALKPLAKGKPPKAYERFYREIEAIRQLDHPRIIKIYDHSKKGDDFNYYVMEYIEGTKTLRKVLLSEANPFHGEALMSSHLFAQLLEAISACESVGVVHRDLCPSNILVLPDLSIKVIDFGICQIEEGETITLTDESVGTPNYMAPECESGASGEATSRSDIYSAGKILWSAITNSNAFSRERLVFGDKSMNSMFPGNTLTWHLHHIFEKTIRHAPNNRYETAEEALYECKLVQATIASRRLPLEEVGKTCPVCGIGPLAPGGQNIRTIPGPGETSLECQYCSHVFVINIQKIEHKLKKRKELQ